MQNTFLSKKFYFRISTAYCWNLTIILKSNSVGDDFTECFKVAADSSLNVERVLTLFVAWVQFLEKLRTFEDVIMR